MSGANLNKEGAGPLKARMSVVLKANDVVIAEVEDFQLWNAVLSAISAGSSSLLQPGASVVASSTSIAGPSVIDAVIATNQANTPMQEPVSKFAKDLGVDVDLLVGACAPSMSEPYLRLDSHHWERMRKDLPSRGPKAVPPIVLAVTILCLWARIGGMGSVTQAQAQSVLSDLGLRDNNPGRGMAGASWLQKRPGGQVVLNPAQISKAICLASCFCTQDWAPWKVL